MGPAGRCNMSQLIGELSCMMLGDSEIWQTHLIDRCMFSVHSIIFANRAVSTEFLVCRHVSLLLPFKSCTLKMEPKISDPRQKRKSVRIAPLQMPMPTSLQTSLCMTCICQFFQRLVGSSTSWQWPWNWIVGLAGDQKTGQFFHIASLQLLAACGFRTQPPYSPEGANQMAGWMLSKDSVGVTTFFFKKDRLRSKFTTGRDAKREDFREFYCINDQ